MATQRKFAFYDFDGTLADSNVVERYAYYARHHPSRLRAFGRTTKLFISIPLWLALDWRSRRLFNEVFYREYRGLNETWLRRQSEALFERVIRPKIYPQAIELIERDRAEGYAPVLVTGELDIALAGVIRYIGFAHVIANALVIEKGKATGKVAQPLIAEDGKVAAMERLCHSENAQLSDCKAYSDSLSDRSMLEAVGRPAAVNPERRLRRLAKDRAWPIFDWKQHPHGDSR